MVARDMCADIKMEEGYMRMSIEYNNENSKKAIEQAISEAEKEMELFPDVTRRAIDIHSGNFSVEFGVEGIPRDAGDFCELVLKKLHIDHCAV